MKEKIEDFFSKASTKKYLPLVSFSLLIIVFCLFFTRLFIKMDDGNFLGIVCAPDFSYFSWLKERYLNISGRTVGEFLLAFFLRHNIIWWKLVNAALIIYITYFFCKVSELFHGEVSLNKRRIFCCCSLFLMIVSCLNPAAFWFSGTFSYLWPFAFTVMTVSPLVLGIADGKKHNVMFVISVFSAVIATSQEQSAASCAALYIILLVVLIVKHHKGILKYVPIVTISVCSFFLFTSPGASGRSAMEAETSFTRYTSMGLIEKLFCGLSSFYANSFYLSFFLMIILVALLSLNLSEKIANQKLKKAVIIFANTFSFLTCIITNISISLVKKALPHIIIRNAFKSGEYDACFYTLIAMASILMIIILAMLIMIIIKKCSSGLPVLLCLAAGFGCAMSMSFSSSIFSSGQRTYFYSNMFVILACIILFSSIKNTKFANVLYKISFAYSATGLFVDFVAFRVLELPLMG